VCLFKDVDGRESPAMTSLELGINGGRRGQVALFAGRKALLQATWLLPRPLQSRFVQNCFEPLS